MSEKERENVCRSVCVCVKEREREEEELVTSDRNYHVLGLGPVMMVPWKSAPSAGFEPNHFFRLKKRNFNVSGGNFAHLRAESFEGCVLTAES